MNIDPAQLRARMAGLAADELRAIVAAPEGHYTAEAREAAAQELSGRVEPNEEVPPAYVAPSATGSAIKSLFALVLAWIGWVFAVIAVMLFLTGAISPALAGLAFLAAGCGLVFAVRALTPSWYRLFTAVAAVYGVLSLAMAAISMVRVGEASPEQLLRGIISLAGAMVLAAGRWTARRRTVRDACTIRPRP